MLPDDFGLLAPGSADDIVPRRLREIAGDPEEDEDDGYEDEEEEDGDEDEEEEDDDNGDGQKWYV